METLVKEPRVEVKPITTLLTEKQIKAIAIKLNEKIDLPILKEGKEFKIFFRIVRKIDKVICRLLPEEIYELVENAQEGITKEEAQIIKRRLIPLVNKEIKLPIISERQEAYVIEIVMDIIFRALEKQHRLEEA